MNRVCFDEALHRPTETGRGQPVGTRDFAPRLLIVIPVYKHPVLVGEAISCALAEALDANGVVVIVNDGCPFVETHEVCLGFAAAYPQQIDYIKTPNGGLSAARNRGVKHGMTRYPSIEAVYLLDADNRLNSGAMKRCLARMNRLGADWLYPCIDKFGIEWSGDYSAPWSLFHHLFENICEAGSLVHRRVFDRGVYFDENMRQGFEDWDFWLQCASAGFKGAPFSDFGFQYRARRESMVRDSSRVRDEILAYMRRKHKKLFEWRNLIQLEHKEAPRYAVVDLPGSAFHFTSIAGTTSRSEALSEFGFTFWGAEAQPSHVHMPHFILVADQAVIGRLAQLRLLDWVFWQIENLLEAGRFVFVFLNENQDDIAIQTGGPEDVAFAGQDKAAIVATTRDALLTLAQDEQGWSVERLKRMGADAGVQALRIAAPPSPEMEAASDAFGAFLDMAARLRQSPFRHATAAKWDWREQNALWPSRQLYKKTRELMHAIAPLGSGALASAREIAMIAPVMSFGGVEQVAIQVALQFRRAGWRTRLVLTQANQLKQPARIFEVFDAVCFLNDPHHVDWNPSGYRYFGHDLQKWAIEGRLDRLVGLLAGCAAVICFQAMQANEVMGWLRRQGMVTATSLHVIDKDAFFAPQGHTYLMLPYEYAYDVVTAPSDGLLDLCSALGAPSEKLLKMANAPTFSVSPEFRASRLAEIAARSFAATRDENRRLRVISIGRQDRQKGGERLAALIRATREMNLPVDWRLVGARVLDGAEGEDDFVAPGADLQLSPAVYQRDQVIDHLVWADALILLSHWEGSPLIILEAQALGVAPIATAVGAVDEMIDSGVDGLLIDNGSLDEVVGAAAACLADLCAHPGLRLELARGAMARAERLNWETTAKPLVDKIAALLAAKGA